MTILLFFCNNNVRYFLAGILAIVFLNGCQEPKTQGERLYEAVCMDCHGPNGEGLRRLIPPLAGADYLHDHDDQLPCIIRNGMCGAIVVNDTMYNQPMPGNEKLSAVEIYNIIQYINSSWGNDAPVPTLQEVKEQLDGCTLGRPVRAVSSGK